ncbi:MAG: TolC family protein, partial [bacterium]
MRLVRLAILLEAIIFLAVKWSVSGVLPLSLQECIEVALAQNPAIVADREAVREAEIGVTLSRSAYFPRIDASSGYTRSGNGATQDSYSNGVTLSQVLFQGGRNMAAVKAARAQARIAQQNLRYLENQIAESVKEAFYSIIQKQEQLALADAVLKRRHEDMVLIRLKYKAGIESDPAVSEAEANVSQAEYEKMSAEERLRLAKIQLNLLMGRSRETPVEIQEDLHAPQFRSRSGAVEMALSSRPEMRREDARLELEKAYMSQSRGSFLPSVNLTASLNRSGDEIFSTQKSWSAGVKATLPLFDGLKTPANYLQSRASLRRQRAEYEQTRQTVEEDVERAYTEWLLARKRMEVAEKNLSATTEMYQLTRLQYQQGKTGYFTFQQRELSLTRAEYEKVGASYNLFTAGARLERAMGMSSSMMLRGEK